MPVNKIVIFVLVLALIGVSWLFRLDVTPVSHGDRSGAVIMVNRWTGEMRFVQGNAWLLIMEVKP